MSSTGGGVLATSALGSPGVCVHSWDESNGIFSMLAQLNHHSDEGATAAVLNCNNQVVASASASGKVLLTLPDPARAPLFEFEPMPGREVASLSFDATSRYLSCVGEHENVFIWDLKKKKQVRELKGHAQGCFLNSVAFSPDGQQIASGGNRGEVLCHNVRGRDVACRLVRDVSDSTDSLVGQVRFSPLRPSVVGVAYGVS